MKLSHSLLRLPLGGYGEVPLHHGLVDPVHCHPVEVAPDHQAPHSVTLRHVEAETVEKTN